MGKARAAKQRSHRGAVLPEYLGIFSKIPETRGIFSCLPMPQAVCISMALRWRPSASCCTRWWSSKGSIACCDCSTFSTCCRNAGPTQLAASDYRLNNDITPINRHRIEIVHRYVRESLELEISQAEIAERLGMTAPSFSRFFRAATGQTFVDFVNILRVHKACRMLGGGVASITEIAMDCGYRNISNFNRQFRALKGMNPSEYREHARLLSERARHSSLKAV